MIPHFKGHIPFINADQMIEVDRKAVEEYGIGIIQMMENAGLNLAMLAREEFLKNDPEGKKVLVIAGSGGNAGGAMVAARRLMNWGAEIELVLTGEDKRLKKETLVQLNILRRMNVKIVEKITPAHLILDGMIGYSLDGDPRDKVAHFIDAINRSGIPVLSLDTPSGLNLNNGEKSINAVKADATMTIGLPKVGLFKVGSSKLIGNLYLADIGLPPEIYRSFFDDIEPIRKMFRESPLVKINKMIVFSE